MKEKGTIPIKYLEALTPILRILKNVKDKNPIYNINEQEIYSQGKVEYTLSIPDYGFYVNIIIEKRKTSSGFRWLLFNTFYPYHNDSNRHYVAYNLPLENLEEKFKANFFIWIDLVSRYYNLENEDPIILSYTDEYFSDLKIDDPKADKEPFNFENQIKIKLYLEQCVKVLERNRTEENTVLVDDAKMDAENLIKSQTSLTKNEVLRKLAKFWAKCRKIGLTLALEITKSIISDTFQKMIGF